ncbi:ATP-dependent helicase HrpB [Shewanella maritima]|uniref:ATP-dependent helicase HrpB n=1 Tax=Shewanella maritima TaxID=2520507 RepID=UPI003735D343
MSQLPIYQVLSELKSTLHHHQQIILEAPTGAGKSTALPLAMIDWPEIKGKILLLEPRRVAARNVARFVAQSLGEKLGERVGYRVRGESRVSDKTRLEVVTEGILTRMIQQDPELTGIDMIIFDEIHERHLTTDIGLALALEVQASLREDLTILAMSATLTGLALESVMPDAVQISCEGRSFPVETLYRPVAGQQAWLTHLQQVVLGVINNPTETEKPYHQGSILVFLPGKGEIQSLAENLASLLPAHYQICPLYGELSTSEQQRAVEAAPDNKVKLVLATNVAESSLTIDGISIVIDAGFQRSAKFNPKTGVNKLSLARISQASAAQRAGRAGRLQPGLCIRLWSHEQQGRLLVATPPEITQAELTQVALECAYWGERSIKQLALLTEPPAVHESLAWQLLQRLQLVDANHKITPLGRQAYQLGTQPRLAHMLLKSKALTEGEATKDLVVLACVLAAIVDARGLPRKGADIYHYLPLALKGQICQQVKQYLKRLNVSADLSQVLQHANTQDIGFLLALAYPDRIAKARGKQGYLLSHGCGVILAAEDSLAAEDWLVVADFQEMNHQKSGRVFLAAKFHPSLLQQALAYLVTEQEYAGWDEQKGRFYAEKRQLLGKIQLATESISQLDKRLLNQALLTQVRAKGLSLFSDYPQLQQLQLRVNLMREHDTQYDWPNVDDAHLLVSLDEWLTPYLSQVRTLSGLARLTVATLVHNSLPWEQQQKLAGAVPTHWLMATGTKAPIRYQQDQSNDQQASQTRGLLSVRLQEAYGLSESPSLFNGKLNITMELLSPAQRPIAVTADLASFWQGPYEHVKKEMKGRYPKHLWPDDPANTSATKFTKKRTLNSSR